MTLDQIVSELKGLVEDMPSRVDTLSAEAMHHKPNPDKWSRKEILGHLVDSALHNWQRFVKVQFAPQPFVFESYEQDKLVLTNQYQQLPAAEILSLWIALNRQVIHVLDNVSADKLDYVTINAGSGLQHSLLWLAEDYLAHLKHHLHKLSKTQ